MISALANGIAGGETVSAKSTLTGNFPITASTAPIAVIVTWITEAIDTAGSTRARWEKLSVGHRRVAMGTVTGKAPKVCAWCVWGGGILSIAGASLGVLLMVVLAAIGIEVAEALGSHFAVGPSIGRQEATYAFTAVCVLLSILLLTAPVFGYVMRGQVKRIQLIKGYFPPEIIVRYFDQFWSGRDGFRDLVTRWKRLNGTPDAPLEGELIAKFDELLKDDFGHRIYVIPAILLMTISAIVLFFGFYGGIALAQELAAAKPEPVFVFGIKLDLVSIAAIFGAYTWVCSNAITRYYQASLHPSDLYWYALRLIVAIPLGEAISMLTLSPPATMPGGDAAQVAAAINTGSYGAFLAFVISMFSFDSLTKILGNVATRFGNTNSTTPAEREDVVARLPGVDEETARKLIAEGITTISQLAAVDPIRVSIRSSLPFDFILGLIDLSLLWNYAGGKIVQLREYGFKGASNIVIYNEGIARRSDMKKLADNFVAAANERDKKKEAVDLAAKVVTDAQVPFATAKEKFDENEARLAEIDKQLQAPSLGASEKDVLIAERDKRSSNDKAALRNTVDEATRELDEKRALLQAAEKLRDDADQIVQAATGDLTNALTDMKKLLADLAEKTKIDASGFGNIMDQLLKDEYVYFVRRLMGVVPVR